MANPTSSHGTKLKIGDGASPETFAVIAGVGDFEGPGYQSDLIEVTNHDSAGGYEEVIPAIKRGQEFTIPIFYDPTDPTHNATDGVLADFEAQVKRNFEMTFPFSASASATWKFQGYIISHTPQTNVNDVVRMTLTIKPTGQPTYETSAT